MSGRAILAMAALVGAAAVAASAEISATPAGRLTYVAWIERGGGTGALASPLTLCEANTDGSSPARLSPRIGSFAEPAWTRDGSTVAFASSGASGSALRVSTASPWAPRTIAQNGRWPAWAPDGARIAFVSANGVVVAVADGSSPRPVAGGEVSAPSWSADALRIAFARGGVVGSAGVFLVPSAGGPETRLNDDGKLPAWSPNGAAIAFVAPAPGAPAALTRDELYVSSPDGSGRVRFSNFAAEETQGPVDIVVGRPAWSPDSAKIAVVRSVIFRGLKGSSTLKRNLLLFDAAGGGRTDATPPGAFRDPAWHAAAPIASTRSSVRPCEIFSTGGSTIRGTAYDDLILGSHRPETILAGGGDDWVHAERGADRIYGGPGRDELWSGPGRDVVRARDGARDVVHCGDEGRDSVHADAVDQLAGRCRRVPG